MRKLKLFIMGGVLLTSFGMISCGGEKVPAVPAGALKAAPASIQFGADLAVNTESVPRSFTITNTASVDVTEISYGLLNGQDKIFLVGSDCTSTLVAGSTCNVSASIRPDQKGKSYNETYFVKYKTEKGDETLSVRLTGSTLSSAGVEIGNSLYLSGTDIDTGGTPIDPATKSFPNTNFGSVSEVSTLALTYQGAKPIVIQVEPATNRVFRVVSDCSVLASGERCNLFTSFAPTGVGSESGIINIIATEEGGTPDNLNVTLRGEGTKPEELGTIKLYETINPNAKPVDLGSTAVGSLASDPKKITLENIGSTDYLYRLTSTIDSVAIDYGTCDGKILAGGKCEFVVTYGPSVISNGSDRGFVSFISGKSTAFIEVIGTATAGTPAGDPSGVNTDKNEVKFPSTEIGFSSEQKVVTIRNSATVPSGKVSMKLNGSETSFSYTTTCVENAILRQGTSCDVFLSFKPIDNKSNIDKDFTDKLVITVEGVSAPNSPIEVNLSGKGKAVSISDNSTNIPNLTISEKRYNFPDTGAGLKSASHQFELTNTGATDITGFTSTSTDLIRFSLDQEFTTCGDTIKAGSSCRIAYTFNAVAATQYRGYIKIYANGAEGTGVSDAHELVELIGRGVLFNKSIYFGFVNGTFKDVTYAVVNDTQNTRVISNTEIETVRWVWKARDDNPVGATDNATVKSATMEKWFPTKTGAISDKFTRLSSAKGDIPQMFSIVSDSCKGQTISAGASCVMRIRYTLPTNANDKKPVSAYVRLYSDNAVIDQFHAVASGEDNVTYFFPPEDTIGTKQYERPLVLWDIQSAVIDQNIYTFSGAGSDLAGTGYTVDNKVRRYDAARNIWVTLRTSGTDYTAIKFPAGVDADQVRMIAYNKRLYFYGGQIKDSTTKFLGRSNYLALLDLDAKTADTDGKWSTLSLNALPGERGQVNMAGFNNKLYLWGGLQRFERNLLYFDLNDNKWYKAGQEKNSTASIASIPEGCAVPQPIDTVPTRRGYAAFIFYGNKLFMHGGMHSINQDDRAACGNLALGPISGVEAYLNNDLWSYEVENYNNAGEPIHTAADVNKWIRLTDVLGGDSSIGITPAQIPAEDEKRPYAREKHEWDILGSKLLLKASGFSPNKGNALVNVGPGNFYFLYDPASNGKTDSNPYNGWQKTNINTDSLAQHKLFLVDGAIWLYNKNIMGMQISSELEALVKK